MSNYNSIITQNNTDLSDNNTGLQDLLNTINTLPSAGEDLDEVLDEQDSIIDQIQAALEGKAAASVEGVFGLTLLTGSIGLYSDHRVDFENCKFGSAALGGMGVGVEHGGATFTDCTFEMAWVSQTNGDISFEHCNLSNNGGLNFFVGACTITNCVFTNYEISLETNMDNTYAITNCQFNNCIWNSDYTSGIIHDALVAGGNYIDGVLVT